MPMESLEWLGGILCNTLFAVSPAIGYIPQIAKGDILLSPLLSMLLIMSGVLRLFYHNTQKYEEVVLVQAIIIIALHTLLVSLNRRPLGRYETKILESKTTRALYNRYGVKGTVFGILCAFILAVNTIGVAYGSYSLCGALSSAFEVSTNLLLLASVVWRRFIKTEFVKEERRSPKELYFCWIIGDSAKFYFLFSKGVPIPILGGAAMLILIDVLLVIL